MAVIKKIDLDRLQANLLTSGLQQKDNPLFQVISQLINALKQVQNLAAGSSSSSSTSNVTLIEQIINGGIGITLLGTDVEQIEPPFVGMPNTTNFSGIENVGYWAPLTDGDPLEMDLISNAGEAIMVWVPTP